MKFGIDKKELTKVDSGVYEECKRQAHFVAFVASVLKEAGLITT